MCVVKFIHSVCLSDYGRYTGHQTGEGGDDADDDERVQDNTVNTSYKEIEEEASPKLVHLMAVKNLPTLVSQGYSV